MTRPMRAPAPLRFLSLAVLALFSAVALGPSPAAAQDFDRWYTVEMGGQRIGWSHVSQTTGGDRVTTTSKMVMKLGRGAVELKVSMESEFVETADGKPLSMTSVTEQGAQPERKEYTFTAEHVEATTIQNGRTTRSTRPLPGGVWLPPAAAAEFTRQRLAAGAEQVVLRTIEPLLGAEPITVTRDILERTTLEVLGRSEKAIRCKVTQSVMPDVPATDWIDERGVPLRTETRIGVFDIVLMTATKAEALRKSGSLELFESTLLKPRGRIEDPRSCAAAVYLLELNEGRMPDLPTAGGQRVERVDDSRLRVSVHAREFAPASAEEAADAGYLASTPSIQADDPAVVALHARAVKGVAAAPAAERAERLRRFVYDHIDDKNLATGFATASEVARTGAGDCTEHGVLLAALLRADGTPARVASGLVYVDLKDGPVFGYHMWTQALLEVEGAKRWVDLDATLPGTPFDATHIALTLSGLGEGETMEAMLPLAGVIGNLAITIEKAE